jgi:hypothetical protein
LDFLRVLHVSVVKLIQTQTSAGIALSMESSDSRRKSLKYNKKWGGKAEHIPPYF